MAEGTTATLAPAAWKVKYLNLPPKYNSRVMYPPRCSPDGDVDSARSDLSGAPAVAVTTAAVGNIGG